MTSTDRFAALVARPTWPLDEAVALVGAHGEPGVDVGEVLARLDLLAADVEDRTPAGVVDALFTRHAFRGDVDTYDDPRNSYLHVVLDRRQGIPITLSVLLVEVARRVGVAMSGVGAPGHFLAVVDGTTTYVDAFGGGRMLDLDEVREFFAERVPVLDAEVHLAPTPPALVVDRVLGNLVRSFQRRGDRRGLRWSTHLRTLLPGAGVESRHAHAMALAQAGAYDEAAALLEDLAAATNDPDRVTALAAGIRAHLN